MSKRLRSCFAASTPSMGPFKRISISTRSGRFFAALAMASGAEWATAVTSYPRRVRRASMSFAVMPSSSTTMMRALPIVDLLLRMLLLRKTDRDGCAMLRADDDAAGQLLHQGLHQLPAHRARFAPIGFRRKPDAVVAYLEMAAVASVVPQPDVNRAPTAVGEGVLQGVRNQFVDDQAAGHGGFGVQRRRLNVDLNGHEVRTHGVRAQQTVGNI